MQLYPILQAPFPWHKSRLACSRTSAANTCGQTNTTNGKENADGTCSTRDCAGSAQTVQGTKCGTNQSCRTSANGNHTRCCYTSGSVDSGGILRQELTHIGVTHPSGTAWCSRHTYTNARTVNNSGQCTGGVVSQSAGTSATCIKYRHTDGTAYGTCGCTLRSQCACGSKNTCGSSPSGCTVSDARTGNDYYTWTCSGANRQPASCEELREPCWCGTHEDACPGISCTANDSGTPDTTTHIRWTCDSPIRENSPVCERAKT